LKPLCGGSWYLIKKAATCEESSFVFNEQNKTWCLLVQRAGSLRKSLNNKKHQYIK
jgi:hypothetical protein